MYVVKEKFPVKSEEFAPTECIVAAGVGMPFISVRSGAAVDMARSMHSGVGPDRTLNPKDAMSVVLRPAIQPDVVRTRWN